MIKIFITLASLAIIATYINAECNNMCSGHGTCGTNDQCTCYRNWRGNDCSERTCQYGIAFIDTPQGDLNHDGVVTTTSVKTQWDSTGVYESIATTFDAQEGHAYMECSNKGLCDRASGECVCFDGYEGSACQRTVCPNSCSGHGVCRNIVDKTQTLSSSTARYAYPLWDGLKNQACVCDPGYDGVACEKRLCPKGLDPLDDSSQAESQTINLDTISSTDKLILVYTDLFGEQWTTDEIATDTHANNANTYVNVQNALVGIPNNVIESITVSQADSDVSGGVKYTITFKLDSNPGDIPLLGATKKASDGTLTVITPVVAAAGQSNDATECSTRGLCDYETGICKCFRGYRLDDCSNQHALAFNAEAL